MKKVFVTAIGGDIGCGVIKALKKSNHDLYILGCDIKKYNFSYDLVDEFLECPSYSNERAWTEFVLKTIKENSVDYFWPVTEPEIRIVDKQKMLFSDVKVVMNATNVLEVAMDKGKTAWYLAENGVKTPRTWNVLEEVDSKFPMIVKEKSGCGSHSVFVVKDTSELGEKFKNMKNPIVQEYIGDNSEEFTLSVFSDGNIVNYIAFKRELGFGGMSRYVELVNEPKLAEVAEKIASMFKLRGSVNVQMRKQEQDYYVFEINPRISSTVGFRTELGFHDVAWWLDMYEGNVVPEYVCPKEKVYGVRMVEEKIFRV
jgi:carbamoyl-phosphate synthase large subunit